MAIKKGYVMLKTMKMRLLASLCMLALFISDKTYTVHAEEDANNISSYFTTEAPTNIRVKTINASSHEISWTPLLDADGYYVYCSAAKSSGYTCIGSTYGTSMRSLDLKTGTVYYYKIQAYKVISSKQYYSPISDASSKAAGHPRTPSISIQKIKRQGKTVAVIRWSNISDAKYIKIYRKKTVQSYQKILEKKITNIFRIGVTISYVKTKGEMQFKARTYNKSGGIRFYSSFSKTKKIKLR